MRVAAAAGLTFQQAFNVEILSTATNQASYKETYYIHKLNATKNKNFNYARGGRNTAGANIFFQSLSLLINTKSYKHRCNIKVDSC